MAERKKAARALSNKTCQEISAIVLAYLTDELSAKTKKEFQGHIKICPDCVNFLNTYEKTVDLSRRLDVTRMPALVRNNILSFLRKQTGRISAALIFLLSRLTA